MQACQSLACQLRQLWSTNPSRTSASSHLSKQIQQRRIYQTPWRGHGARGRLLCPRISSAFCQMSMSQFIARDLQVAQLVCLWLTQGQGQGQTKKRERPTGKYTHAIACFRHVCPISYVSLKIKPSHRLTRSRGRVWLFLYYFIPAASIIWLPAQIDGQLLAFVWKFKLRSCFTDSDISWLFFRRVRDFGLAV